MRKTCFLFILVLTFHCTFSQKPALDHSVYDGWESIGERMLSPDGKYLVYTIVPQEGDGRLVIRSTETGYAKEIPRGAAASITADSRWLVCQIKPFFKDTREARIKKKTPDQMPKDSLACIGLGTDSMIKIPNVKSYKLPEKQGSWLAYLLERSPAAGGKGDSTAAGGKRDSTVAKGKAGETIEEGTTLVLKDLGTGAEKRFSLASEYYFSKNGNTCIIETTRKNKDSLVKPLVLWVNTTDGRTDTVMKGFNDAKNYALDEQGGQLAFVAERDSAIKALVKFYRLWYYTRGMDSAVIRADRAMVAMPARLTISADYANNFSRDGNRLFLGLAPVRPPKDTNLVDFETARLDIWNYKDDYLSPQQLKLLDGELKRSYLAVINKDDGKLVPLGDEDCEYVIPGAEGNAPYALGSTDKGYRIQQQWEASGLQKLFLIDLRDGRRKLIRENVREGGSISSGGKFVLWYDRHQKNWYTWSIADGEMTNITAGIRQPLYDEEDDHPDDPPPYGSMGWHEDDRWVYIYDKYDIWQCDPRGQAAPVNLTRGLGRAHHQRIRYVRLDKDDPFIHDEHPVLLTVFDTKEMTSNIQLYKMGTSYAPVGSTFPVSYNGFFKAKNSPQLGYLKGSFDKSYDVYVGDHVFSHINPQQEKYNWFTVELHHWKMLDGRGTEGLLYKPENFDSTKKYPIIFYYYERDAETRYQYIAPQPVRASVNIPWFTSNGYLVFDPDIWYKTGTPGEDAYNSIMSAVRYLSRFKWVDTTKMALQGHSWGGYQTAYMVTRTGKFAAAEAGAPVANMTSAYGGIRWGTGISRQFQYERSQSRLGATLWQRPDLYIKNSPLFRADKVTTPLLIMHNDLDGAVPWYQGIELFSALRRLGKKVWLIQYNGEDHGLMERRNRKDWSIRLAQFFGYYLKGEPPARWIREGVPATLKGIDWGLGTE